MTRPWNFLTFGVAERQFSGNAGYDDRIDCLYSIDGAVPNTAVAEGDLAVVRDSLHFLGFGWIDGVETWSGSATRYVQDYLAFAQATWS